MREKYLFDIGFEKVYSEDQSAFWYEKKIKNRLFNKLHISVENNYITVWCYEPKNYKGRNDYVNVLVYQRYSADKLNKIINMFR
jgi:hypothetical protein